AIHWWAMRATALPENHTYSVFLGLVLGLSIAADLAQIALPSLRRWMSHMCPIIAAAILLLSLWEVITSGFRLLPLPYFPSPAGVMQSMINDRALLFDSTWHSLVLLLGGYGLGVASGFITGVCIGWSKPVRYWGMPLLKVVGPIP